MARASKAGFRWYLIRTAPLAESYLAAQLRRLSGAEVYVPLIEVPQRYLRGAHVEPLFPGYIFARLNLSTQRAALERLAAFGSLVSLDGRPASVDATVIGELRRRERGRGYISLSGRAGAGRLRRGIAANFPRYKFLEYRDGMQRIASLIGAVMRACAGQSGSYS